MDIDIIPFEGPDQGFGHAVGLRVSQPSKTTDETEAFGKCDDFFSFITAAIVAEPFHTVRETVNVLKAPFKIEAGHAPSSCGGVHRELSSRSGGARYPFFFMGMLYRFRKNLILHGFLAQHLLRLARPPFQFLCLTCKHYGIATARRFASCRPLVINFLQRNNSFERYVFSLQIREPSCRTDDSSTAFNFSPKRKRVRHWPRRPLQYDRSLRHHE